MAWPCPLKNHTRNPTAFNCLLNLYKGKLPDSYYYFQRKATELYKVSDELQNHEEREKSLGKYVVNTTFNFHGFSLLFAVSFFSFVCKQSLTMQQGED